jgi:hypothetical protein
MKQDHNKSGNSSDALPFMNITETISTIPNNDQNEITIPDENNEEDLKNVATLINNAKNVKILTLTNDDDLGSLNKNVVKDLCINTSTQDLSISYVSFSRNIMLDLFTKFTHLTEIEIIDCPITFLNKPSNKKIAPFNNIKKIRFEYFAEREADEFDAEEYQYFTIKSLEAFIANCPKLESLSLEGFVLLIKNTKEDFENLKSFVGKYVHIITGLSVCLSNEEEVKPFMIDEKELEKYKCEFEKIIQKSLENKKTINKTCDIGIKPNILKSKIIDVLIEISINEKN